MAQFSVDQSNSLILFVYNQKMSLIRQVSCIVETVIALFTKYLLIIQIDLCLMGIENIHFSELSCFSLQNVGEQPRQLYIIMGETETRSSDTQGKVSYPWGEKQKRDKEILSQTTVVQFITLCEVAEYYLINYSL